MELILIVSILYISVIWYKRVDDIKNNRLTDDDKKAMHIKTN